MTPPAFAPRHVYGGEGTIHKTGTVDIQLDEVSGEIVAVWFRCLSLPWTVSTVPSSQPSANPVHGMAIEEITYVELGERSSQ